MELSSSSSESGLARFFEGAFAFGLAVAAVAFFAGAFGAAAFLGFGAAFAFVF